MKKKLSPIGNSLGLIIDRPILELLRIDRDTELEVSTDGSSLIVRPVATTREARLRAATDRVVATHRDAFRRLAE